MNKRLLGITIAVMMLFAASLTAFIYALTQHLGSEHLFFTAFSQSSAAEKNATDKTGKDFKIPETQPEQTAKPSPFPNMNIPELKDTKPRRLVVIDPGHGGNDAGTRDNGVVEKEVTLDIALRLDALLKKSNVHTYMIRTQDVYMDHKERILKANELEAALFLSIHCDWFSDPSQNGTQTLYYPSKALAIGNLIEIDYANIIQNELIKALKTNNRGINDRPNLAVLRHAKMPSVLVELGFLSNKSDAQRLSSEEFRQTAAQAFADGIKKALAKID